MILRKKTGCFLLVMAVLLSFLTPIKVSAYTLGDKDYRRKSSEKIIGEKISVKYDDGQFDENLGTYSYTYDNAGRIFIDGRGYHFFDNYDHEVQTHFSEYYYVGMGNEYQYKRNNDGLLTEILHTGETQAQEIFSYDPFGNIIKSEYLYNAEAAKYTYVTTYTYGRNYQLNSISTVNQLTGKTDSDMTFTYNSDGTFSKVVTNYYYEDGSKQTSEENYRYGSGYLGRIDVTNGNGDTTGTNTLYYDSAYRLIKSENHCIYGGNQEWATIVTEYQYNSGSETATEKPEVTRIYPESGLSGEKMFTRLDIDFNLEIESVNLSSGTFYLVNNTDDTDYVALTNADTSFRYDGNHLVLIFPDSFAYKDKNTYHLEIDNHVMKFKNSLESFEVKDNSLWEYTPDSEAYGSNERISKDGTFKYYSGSLESRSGTAAYSYNDRWFDNSAYDYNSALAQMSLSMAMAAFSADGSNPSVNIETLLKELEFENIEVQDSYRQTGTGNTIGTVFATKQLDGDVTLLNISLRGENYNQEYLSNFLLGEEAALHEGFDAARSNVESDLMSYLMEGAGKDIRGTLVFWIQGYGRAGSVANLLGKALDEGIDLPNGLKYQNRKVFVYCFEPFSTSTADAVGDSSYSNIFNLINPVGMLSHFPCNGWGFSRYGVNVYLPVKGLDANYRYLAQDVLKQFNTLMNMNSEALQVNQQVFLNQRIFRHILEDIPDRSTYFNNYQTFLSENYTAPRTSEERAKNVLNQLVYVCYGIRVGDSFAEKIKGLNFTNEEYLFFRDLPSILRASSPEMFLSWLNVLNQNETAQPLRTENARHDERQHNTMNLVQTSFSGPLEVKVFYDGELIAESSGSSLSVLKPSCIDGRIMAENGKTFVTPNNAEVRFEITGKTKGTFSAQLMRMDVVAMYPDTTVFYLNQEINEGSKFTLTLLNTADGSMSYALTDSSGKEIGALSSSADSMEYLKVTADMTGNGIIFGEGSYEKNSLCTLTAVPMDNYHFVGWYENDTPVSNKQEFPFEVTKEVKYTAKFELDVEEKEDTKNDSFIKLIAGIVIGSCLLYGLAVLISRITRRNKRKNSNDIIPR